MYIVTLPLTQKVCREKSDKLTVLNDLGTTVPNHDGTLEKTTFAAGHRSRPIA